MEKMNRLLNKLNKIINQKEVIIPTYEYKREKILEISKIYKINFLVETGTFLGDTVYFFMDYFEKVYSIELAEDLASNAKMRFNGVPNVEIIHGDSGVELFKLVDKFTRPVLFWLDGHYSGEFELNGTFIKTALSEKQTPIELELQAILSCSFDHIVMIDDARLFNGENDYPTLRKIQKILRKHKTNYSFKIENDIIFLTPSI